MCQIYLRRVARAFGLAVTLALAATPAAPAQTYTWDGGLSHNNFTVNDLWSTPNNWVGGAPPVSGSNTDLVFTQSGSWTTADQNTASPFVLHSITFNAANTNFTAISDGPLQFNFGNGSSPFITQSSATAVTVGNAISLTSSLIIQGTGVGSLTFNGSVSGSGGLVADSAGTIVLTGNSSYMGGTLFDAGIVRVGNAGALGSEGALTFNGGTLQYGSGITTDYSSRFGTLSGQPYSVDTNGQNVTFAAPLQASGSSLIKLGAGTLTLSNAANAYSGGTSILGGTLRLGANALPAGSVNLANTAGAALDLNGFSATIYGLTGGGPAGGNVLTGGGTLTVGADNSTTTFAGSITGAGTVTKAGTGTLTLTGASSNFFSLTVQTGIVTLNGGALTLTSNSTIYQTNFAIEVGGGSASASLVVQGGTVLDTSTAVEAVAGFSSVPQSITVQGAGTVWKLPGQTDIGSLGTGTLTIQNGGKVTGGTYVNLGNAGTGAIQVLAGGQLTTGSVVVAFGGFGTLSVAGAGATLTAGSILLATDGGSETGTLTVFNGGSVAVANTQIDSLTSSITVNGGTLSTDTVSQIAGAAIPIAISDPPGGAALTIGTNSSSSTLAGPIVDAAGGPGTVNKVGAGTLTLTGHLTNTGGYTASAGTIEFSGAVVQPGSGSLTAAAGATIQYDTGARVFGGFLYGPGTHVVTGGATFTGTTAFNSAVINVTGAGSLISFTNGGSLTVAAGPTFPTVFNGFTNQTSGSITIGAASAANAADFESYGTLTLTPNTTAAPTTLTNTGNSPLAFGGGSRTFIGTPSTATMNGQPTYDAGINLNGQNAVVAGGLFVNNGFVADGSAAGTATIVADFGSLVKGAGFFQNSVITQNGGKFQAGNSPGSASFGNFVLGPGGVNSYVFAIDDATGTAGPHSNVAGQVSGWALVSAVQQQMGSITTPGNFTWTADPADRLTLALDTLVNPTIVGTDVAGPMADFNPSLAYSWPAVCWTGSYSGPTDALALDAATSFDTTGFENPINGTFGWSFDAADQTLSLTYSPTPVPEPGTLAFTGVAAIGWVTFSRRRWQSNGPAATLSA